MKKIIICLMVLSLLVCVCSCNKEVPQEENYNLPVTEEPFESMEVKNSYTTHLTFNSEAELYENSELVFIGMPTDTFTECETIYYNLQGKQIPKDSGEKFFDYSTLRNVKIIEVIKGDIDKSEIKVADMAAVKTDNNKSSIIGLPSGMFIQKKNVKYIYYVHKARDDKNDYYFTHFDSGMINVDGLHPEVNKILEGSTWYYDNKMEVLKEKYAEQFSKYNRTSELAVK